MMSIAASLVVFGLLACGGEEAVTSVDEVAIPAATNEAPPPPADVDVELPVLPDGASLEVDVESSKIEFTGAKVTGSHDGGFTSFSGTVIQKDDTVIGTKFVIDMATTMSDQPKLTKHLMSKDFFQVDKYPSATFVSSELVPAQETGAVTHNVKGVLEFHGKTRPLSFPATVTVGEAATTVEATFDINRQNWGVSYPGKPDNLIKDDVQIRLSLRFPTGSAGFDNEASEKVETPAGG